MLIIKINTYNEFKIYFEKYRYIFVNISASWCKPCMELKPNLEKFINVIDEPEYIYLKISEEIYNDYSEFNELFNLSKIPYFAFIKDRLLIDSFISRDLETVSKRIFNHITLQKNTEKKELESNFNNDEDF